MEVLNRILIVLLLCCLVVSLFAVLNDKEYIPVGSLLENFKNSNTISTDWVNSIRIDVHVPDNAILQSIVDFINDYILLPIRLIMILGTMIINVLLFVFNYVQLYFIS